MRQLCDSRPPQSHVAFYANPPRRGRRRGHRPFFSSLHPTIDSTPNNYPPLIPTPFPPPNVNRGHPYFPIS